MKMNHIDEMQRISESYCQIVEAGLQERWDKMPVQLYDSETYEAIGGLLARQATLTIYLALSPSIWNGHIAPLILRSMTDAHITLAWILIDPKERAKKYILYGLGQEKLQIEHLRAERDKKEDKDTLDELIKAKEAHLNAQRVDFLTEVEIGSWSGHNTRELAQEAGCEDLYKFAYTPFSAVTHNMWQHISIYNLRPCGNPLHKYHRVPAIADMPVDPDYLYRSAKYVNKSYHAVDSKFDLQIETGMPLKYLETEFDKILAKETDGTSQTEE